ncbi:transcription factor bHLH18-like [Gastrolobium bilobum]|uniref:transcription factor bHLH18-like n=1 Tax=Gastrolobium bilobum TaxID=150636 RepID=UPI002AB2D171|nr:transcription factor bHLH18-like [Gastrolobium bilobum]
MGHDNDFLEQSLSDVEEEFLREILQQPILSSESETRSFVQNDFTATFAGAPAAAAAATDGSSLSSNEIGGGSNRPVKRPRPLSSPRTFILSFDNSTIIPATPELVSLGTCSSKSNSPLSSKKRILENQNIEPKPKTTQGAKRGRSDSQTLDHIMAERKRRQELTERFIALSAVIPGLKKTDKTNILREAINYVKQLQERVTELEERNMRGKESMIILKKAEVCANEDNTSSETNSEDCCRGSELLPDVEARVLENEVLIEIHCEKENGIELKLLDQLENLNLFVTGSSVLPFGNSTLGITIIAQMGDAFGMRASDLVKSIKQVLSNHISSYTDPY